MSSLRRTMAAGFTLDQAVTLDQAQEQGEALLLPTDSLFSHYPVFLLKSERAEKRVRNGNPLSVSSLTDGTYRVYSQQGEFLCLSRCTAGTLTSLKNFFGG